MDGVAVERSIIYPMTDFVDLIPEKISLIGKLEIGTAKQSITNGTNCARKQSALTSEHPNPVSQFSRIGASVEYLTMLET